MTNCTTKKPKFEGEYIVFESPHASGVLLVDVARFDQYKRLAWEAVRQDAPEAIACILEYRHQNK